MDKRRAISNVIVRIDEPVEIVCRCENRPCRTCYGKGYYVIDLRKAEQVDAEVEGYEKRS